MTPGTRSHADDGGAHFVAGPRLWLDLAVELGWTASSSEAVAATLRAYIESPAGRFRPAGPGGRLPLAIERIVASLESVAPRCYQPFAPRAVASPTKRDPRPDARSASQRPTLHVVTGFLGAGKTTLVNALLAEPSRGPTLVVVNELGDAPVDDRIVLALGAPIEVVAVAGGCLCCAVGDDLVDGLVRLLAARESGSVPRFAHILVETSGAADPGLLVERLLDDRWLRERVDFRGVVAVVDACAFEEDFAAIGEVARQLATASQVVVSKADLLDDEAREPVSRAIRAAVPDAEVVVPACTADAASALVRAWAGGALPVRSRSVGARDLRHDADRGVVTLRGDAVSTAGLRLFCDVMMLAKGHELYRMKGEAELAEGGARLLLQGVRSRVQAFVPDGHSRAGTRLTLIGRRLQARSVRALFDRLAFAPTRARNRALTSEPSVAAPTEKWCAPGTSR